MPCVVKDRDNPFTKSRYATLENVNTVIRPVYTQHGFSLSYGRRTARSPTTSGWSAMCPTSAATPAGTTWTARSTRPG
jgi:hypothetical protein